MHDTGITDILDKSIFIYYMHFQVINGVCAIKLNKHHCFFFLSTPRPHHTGNNFLIKKFLLLALFSIIANLGEKNTNSICQS